MADKGEGDALDGYKTIKQDVSNTRVGQAVGAATEVVSTIMLEGVDKTLKGVTGQEKVATRAVVELAYAYNKLPEGMRDVLDFASFVGAVTGGSQIVKAGTTKALQKSGKGINGPNANFYVKSDNTTIPATGYRAIVGDEAVKQAKQGNLNSNKSETYFTFNNISNKSPDQIKSGLQIKREPSHYGEFDTLQIIDDIKIPKEYWNKGSKNEPITISFPDLGEGGLTQAITTKPIKDFNLKKINNGGN